MLLSRRSKAAIVVTVLLVGVGAFATPSRSLMTYPHDRAVDPRYRFGERRQWFEPGNHLPPGRGRPVRCMLIPKGAAINLNMHYDRTDVAAAPRQAHRFRLRRGRSRRWRSRR